MIIRPCAHGLDATLGASTLPRSPGLHISTIYNDLYARLEPKRFGKAGPPPPELLEMGLAWEEMLGEGLARRLGLFRPGEVLSEEGIALSPDGLIPEEGGVRVAEFKATRMSSREMPGGETSSLSPKYGKWDMQMRAYCHVMGTTRARLYVLFVSEGAFKAWDVEYTERDLLETWAVLMQHGRVMGVLRARADGRMEVNTDGGEHE